MKEIAVIVAARNHKAFNPTSVQHAKFLQENLEKIKKINDQFSYIDFSNEISFFEAT